MIIFGVGCHDYGGEHTIRTKRFEAGRESLFCDFGSPFRSSCQSGGKLMTSTISTP